MYSFCESVFATPWSRWHIRKLTDEGQKFGGGIDTPSLCGKIGPPKSNGWDINVHMTEHHLSNCCSECQEIFEKETSKNPNKI